MFAMQQRDQAKEVVREIVSRSDSITNGEAIDLIAAALGKVTVSDGVRMIADERWRQGYSREHDDQHADAELTAAAVVYANAAINQIQSVVPSEAMLLDGWPWERESYHPSDNTIYNLQRAGALIAAEIDRLLRAKSV